MMISDAWVPQINGVVRTLQSTQDALEQQGHQVCVIGPQDFRTVPLPSYPEIRLSLRPARRLERMIADFAPDAVHLATEGPLGWAGRSLCRRLDMPFSTAVHTLFPEYVASRTPVPVEWGYAVMRRFHRPSAAVMVATSSLEDDLRRRGFANLRRWTRGADMALFRPLARDCAPLPQPIMLYAGRIAVEKNLPAFLDLNLPGTKMVVGDGPQRQELQKRYPDAIFTGALKGDDLAHAYSRADIFVFPSKTDTFGMVVVEALACGTPVAAFPVPGPKDVLEPQSPDMPVGVLDADLGAAVRRALSLEIPAERCRAFAMQNYTWEIATAQFASIAFGLPQEKKPMRLSIQ
jgi:glycosyltransferase involved in cell wall biosynthesis